MQLYRLRVPLSEFPSQYRHKKRALDLGALGYRIHMAVNLLIRSKNDSCSSGGCNLSRNLLTYFAPLREKFLLRA